MAPPTSSVWTFFKKLDSKSCSCNLCGRTYRTSGNTTNLATHLRNKHYSAYLKFTAGKQQSKELRKKLIQKIIKWTSWLALLENLPNM